MSSVQNSAWKVASSSSRAGRVGTRRTQAARETASQLAAFGASQGASNGTFAAMRSRRAMATPKLARATGLIRGVLLLGYRCERRPDARRLSPVSWVR